jgi:hypothetical protein
MRDEKDPSKFCGKMHSKVSREQLVYEMPRGILWINQGETGSNNVSLKRFRMQSRLMRYSAPQTQQ